jgi:hypothetical protein
LESHRAVILPDFQGMGIGVRFTEIVAQHQMGVIGFHKNSSPKIRVIRKNHHCGGNRVRIKLRKDVTNEKTYNDHVYDNKRLCFSYEYIGDNSNLV